MKRDSLITPKNKELYHKIQTHYKVHLIKNKNSQSWGASISKEKIAEIYFYKTKHPISAFTHELLHINTQLEGYKRLRGAISLNLKFHSKLAQLLTCLDNEFQHHKMYDKFIEMGFPSIEFYNDSDSEVEKYLRNGLLKANLQFEDLVLYYMSLIAPGGSLTTGIIEQLKAEFRNYQNGIFMNRFNEIDKVMNEWKSDKGFDAEQYIKRIFHIINSGSVWITYDNIEGLNDKNFPTTGFFTENEFSLIDISRIFNKN